MSNAWPRARYGAIPMRISQPSGDKDIELDAYVVADGGDGYPAMGLSGNRANTWYRPLLTYHQLVRMVERIEHEIDVQRGEHAQERANG